MRRPVKELARPHHSGTPCQNSTVAHKPDLSETQQYSRSRWLAAGGSSSAAGAKLDLAEFTPYLSHVSVYACSRVNASDSGRKLYISPDRKLYFDKNANVCLQQLHLKF